MLLIKIFSSFLFYTVAVIISATVLSFLDSSHFYGIHPEVDTSFIQKYFQRFYFASTTLSTVGYGDITPKSTLAKSITIVLQFIATIGVISIITF